MITFGRHLYVHPTTGVDLGSGQEFVLELVCLWVLILSKHEGDSSDRNGGHFVSFCLELPETGCRHA